MAVNPRNLMENEPQEPAKEAPGGRTARAEKPRGTAGSPTPRWLWLLVLAGFGLIFWSFTPDHLPFVLYNPWFLDQVERDNIESLRIRGTEIRGRLRTPVPGQTGANPRKPPITQFLTYAPGAQAVEPLVRSLRERQPGRGPVAIEVQPAGRYSLRSWMALVLSPVLLAVVFLVIRTIAAALGR